MADKLAHDEMKKENIAGLCLPLLSIRSWWCRAPTVADVENHAPA
jgi:hypothetical protein